MEARFRLVSTVAADIMRMFDDIYLFVPIAHSHPLAIYGDMPGDWEFWRGYDLAFLNFMDEFWICELEGWRDSTGVTAETERSLHLALPVRFVDPQTIHVSSEPHNGPAIEWMPV
jgi:hypothetical protein